jgi:hypothetical protein
MVSLSLFDKPFYVFQAIHDLPFDIAALGSRTAARCGDALRYTNA